MTLEQQIRAALSTFASSFAISSPYERERELVSRFVISHLLPTVQAGAPLFDVGQVGLEVAVPQRRDIPNKRHDPDVCKDVVIWPRPGMVCWDDNGKVVHYPSAVLEWKSINRKDSVAMARKKTTRDRPGDVEWLRSLVLADPSVEGYSALVDLKSSPSSLTVTRVVADGDSPDWFRFETSVRKGR